MTRHLNVTRTGLQPSTGAPLYCLETLVTGHSELTLSSLKIFSTLDSSEAWLYKAIIKDANF